MKIIAVGDIHGRDTWKKVAAQEADFDKFVFVGDYFDNWPPMTPKRMFENFKDILAFKEKHGDKVELLMGNHDFQYTPMGKGEQYSGYNPITQANLDGLEGWYKPLEASYQYADTFFSHAGVTKTWAALNAIPEHKATNLSYEVNRLFYSDPDNFKFYRGDTSYCGEHVRQGPFWVRPDTLLEDIYPAVWQVVGHSNARDGLITKGKLVMIDTGKQGDYLKIINGVMVVGTI